MDDATGSAPERDPDRRRHEPPTVQAATTTVPLRRSSPPTAGAPPAGPSASAADLTRLFDETALAVHRAAFRVTGRAEDAEDVLQSVFLHLLRGGLPQPPPGNVLAYLRRASVNAALDLLRRRKRLAEVPVAESLPAGGRDEEATLAGLDRQRLARRLREALGELTPLEAEVFALRHFEDVGNGEIADLIGKTPNHVGVILHSARGKLRAALSIQEGGAAASQGDVR